MAKEKNTFNCRTIDFNTYSTLISKVEHSLYFAPWWLETIIQNKKNSSLLLLEVATPQKKVALFVAMQESGQIITADYCQHLGICYLTSNLNLYQKQEICLSIHNALPKHHFFHLNFSAKITDWLAWHWLGYKQTTRYNYILPISKIKSAESFINLISKNSRKRIKRNIRDGFTYCDNIELSEALPLIMHNAHHQGYKLNENIVKALIEKSLANKSSDLIGIRAKNGKLAKVSFLVRHQERVYNIFSGNSRTLGGQQLKMFLLMNYIIDLDENIKLFDFEGSMLESVAKIAQAMGASQEPYFTIRKGNRYALPILWQKMLNRF